MASPISSTRRTDRPRRAAYTLVELLMAAGLSGMVLAGVLSAFLMIGRTSANAANYSELETQARRALELFSREARMAYQVPSLGSSSVTLNITDTSTSRTGLAYAVTYAYDAANSRFTRTGPPPEDPSATPTTTVLMSGAQELTPGAGIFTYYRYVNHTNYSNQYTYDTTTNPVEVKQIEINFVAQRTSVTVATATNKVLSARFILRNK